MQCKLMHTIHVFCDYFVHDPTRLRTAQYVPLSNIQDFWGDKHGRDPFCSFQDHWTGINDGWIWFHNFHILSKLHIVNSLGIRVVHLNLSTWTASLIPCPASTFAL